MQATGATAKANLLSGSDVTSSLCVQQYTEETLNNCPQPAISKDGMPLINRQHTCSSAMILMPSSSISTHKVATILNKE
jgi:hypothetical protein